MKFFHIKECECYGAGSISDQCDKINGSCQCQKGIRGHNCDTCDRGTTGTVPYCKQCGECFDDWNKIVTDVKDQLDKLEEDASNLAVASGSTIKDFTGQYAALEDKLNDIRKIIPLNYTDRQLKMLNDLMTNINKQIDSKKKSREKYYDIEKWTQENPENQFNEAKNSFKLTNQKTDELTQEAMDLKESHETGAIDSINRASRQSSDAQYQLDQIDTRLNAELRPVLQKMKQKLELSREKLSKSDEMLKGYFGDIVGNLSVTENAIFGLNKAVCGGVTNENVKCDSKCGGALCEGKCGTNTSSCSSLMDSYLNLLSVRSNFEELYSNQEQVFKRILTKMINSTNYMNFANKEINSLLEYANKSLDSIDTKQKDLSNLIEQIDKNVAEYREKPRKIEENCNYAANLNIDMKENEIEEMMRQTRDLAANININTIESDTASSQTQANQLLAKIEQVGSYLPEIKGKHNRTSESIEAEINKTQAVEANLAEFEKKSEIYSNNLKEVFKDFEIKV